MLASALSHTFAAAALNVILETALLRMQSMAPDSRSGGNKFKIDIPLSSCPNPYTRNSSMRIRVREGARMSQDARMHSCGATV